MIKQYTIKVKVNHNKVCIRAVIGRVVSAHLKIWRETTIFYTLIEASGRMAEYLARVQLTIWAERANLNKKLEFSQSIFNIFNMTFYGK